MLKDKKEAIWSEMAVRIRAEQNVASLLPIGFMMICAHNLYLSAGRTRLSGWQTLWHVAYLYISGLVRVKDIKGVRRLRAGFFPIKTARKWEIWALLLNEGIGPLENDLGKAEQGKSRHEQNLKLSGALGHTEQSDPIERDLVKVDLPYMEQDLRQIFIRSIEGRHHCL